MTAIRNLSIALFAIIAAYTFFVIINHGPDFFTPYLTGVLSGTWQGQFNLDFGAYLVFTAFWVAWRHMFSGKGLLLATGALVLGLLFFAPYLVFASRRSDSVEALLLGERVAQAS